MNRKPTNIRRLVTAVLASGLLMASTNASSDHRRHTNDIAEGLLAGAIAALTIGIILQEVDGRVDDRHERHYIHRPNPYHPSLRYRHVPRVYGWDQRHWRGNSHGFHHQPNRMMHSRVDRSWGGNRPIHDRRDWKRERDWKRVH